MDSIKLEKLLNENMKSVFGFALTRLGNVLEAEELSSDILYAIVRSQDKLRDKDRFYGFMWKIAENVYKDYLRRKIREESRKVELDESIANSAETPLDDMIKSETLNILRRELSLLSKQYRDTTVLYYIKGLSCSEIAEKLETSTEMVKYHLFRARKILREGMNMERLFGEKSYRPNGFEIDFWGTHAGDSAEYTAFRERKIKGNILLAAYYTPVTLKEISIELGVALPYLEDEVKLLLQREYLISKNGKYLTNIPIFTQDCTLEIENKLKELTEETAKKFAEIADSFDSRFGDRFGDENLTRWQKILLCLHFSLIDTENHLRENYEEPTADGPYVHVNSGGGKGIVWGRSTEDNEEKERPDGIQGIYNGCPSSDSRGSVIAMNFMQTLNSQDFDGGMTDPVVCTAVDCYEYLPVKWKDLLNDLGYAKNGKANFAVWTYEEYCCLKDVLSDSINLLSEMNRKTSEIAAKITADLAPTHIHKTAEYVGAFVYRFNSIEKLVNVLFDTGYLKKADDKSKPAICVVKN